MKKVDINLSNEVIFSHYLKHGKACTVKKARNNE